MNIKPGARRMVVGVVVAATAASLVQFAVALGAEPTSPAVAASAIAASLGAKGAATQPAGMPVTVELTLTNTGNEPLQYWCGGPAEYPQGTYFSAEVTPIGGKGRARTFECFNGQYVQGSGNDRQIRRGTSVEVPLSIAPLPAGDYEIVFKSREDKWTDPMTKEEKTLWPAARSTALRIVIRDDATLAGTVCEAWVGQVLLGEPFAMMNVTQWKTPQVIAKLVPALAGDNKEAALNAAIVMSDLEATDLPRETGAVTTKAIERGLRPPRVEEGRPRRKEATSASPTLLMYLAKVAGNAGSDDALAAVVKLTHLNIRLRWEFVQSLARFPQPQATKELEKLLTDEDSSVRSEAVNALAERGDTAVIPELLKLIETGSDDRASEVEALSHFPNDPRAVAAIETARKDSDTLVRQEADRAWQNVKDARAKQGKSTQPK